MEREIKEKAIVLKSENSGDADRMLYLLSPERGLFKAKIRGVKKPKAKLAFASFPFCFGEYLLVKTGNNYTVTNCNFIDNFSPLTEDINKYYAGASILEVGLKTVQENEACTELFVAIINSLTSLAYSNENIFYVLSKFLINALGYLGLGISVAEIGGSNAYFDFETGRVTSSPSENSAKIDQENINTILGIIKPNNEQGKEQKASKLLLCILVSYFEYKTEEKLVCMQEFCN